MEICALQVGSGDRCAAGRRYLGSVGEGLWRGRLLLFVSEIKARKSAVARIKVVQDQDVLENYKWVLEQCQEAIEQYQAVLEFYLEVLEQYQDVLEQCEELLEH